jgi:thiosulfate/3-mercaptopyruvate sulfurtransferase
MPDSTPPLVSTEWLAARLGDPAVRVLDASWYLPSQGRDGRAEYLAGHIPGAGFFDLDEASDPGSPLPHMLPDDARFAAIAGALGIGDGATVVVYDGSGANMSAARAWWMFRAYGHEATTLLDGGLGKWKAEGRPLERGEARSGPRSFTARLDRRRVRDGAAVGALDGAAQVVDARAADRFEARAPEPRAGVRSGHVPGSRNVPFTSLVRPDGTLLHPAGLRRRFAEAGVDPARPVVALCGSGVSACAVLHALAVLGGDGTLYDGSWTEWGSSDRPIETGPAREGP